MRSRLASHRDKASRSEVSIASLLLVAECLPVHATLSLMSSGETPTTPPVDDGVDVTLIRWMLSLSAEERLAVLQGFTDSVASMTDESARS